MRERPGDKPYPAERKRQRRLTRRLLALIGLLLGAIAGVLIVRYGGW